MRGRIKFLWCLTHGGLIINGNGISRQGRPGWTLIPISSHGCSAAPVIHICSLSGQFPQPQAFSVLTTTHRSSELILLLWQHAGDLGHAVMAVFLFFIFCGHLKSCQHPPILPDNLTLTFPGDFPQRCVRACVCEPAPVTQCVCARSVPTYV